MISRQGPSALGVFVWLGQSEGPPPYLQLPERLERLDAPVGGLDGPGRERGGRLAVLQRRPRVALPAARQQRRRAVRVQQRAPRRAVQALQER